MRGSRRRSIGRGDGLFEGINITPFTDVLLVLLIIFLIAGSSMAPTGVAVDRLVATSPNGEETSDPLIRLKVEIDAEGETHFDFRKRSVTWESLATLDPTTPVTLSADSRTPSGIVVNSYDRLQRVGFSNIEWGPPVDGEQATAH